MSQRRLHFSPAGESPIERLPSELLLKILRSVSSPPESGETDSISQWLPVDPNAKVHPPPCLLPCLLTCRTLCAAALPAMYRNIEASRFSTLYNFLAQLKKYPQLGLSVRRLDLSHVLGSTNSSAKLGGTKNPLLEALFRTPLVREIRIGNSIEEYLNEEVLEKLFCGLPYLESLDLSACNSPGFVEACATLFDQNREITKVFKSLSLAKCSDLPPEFFEWLLPQISCLRRLDISNTQITSAAMFGIPATSKLTHLNVSHCYSLDGKDFIDFLPSAKNLVYLNLEILPGIEQQFLGEDDISRILSNLPPTMRTLNLKNSAMTSAHVPLLRGLSAQLEELSLGAHLRLRDIEALFLGPENFNSEEMELDTTEPEQIESKYQTVLTPMEEAVAVCKLRQKINSAPQNSHSTQIPRLRYLDIGSLPVAKQCKIQTSILLGPQTMPLEIIEISENALRRCGVLTKLCAAVGWEVKSVGRRCWMRRRDDR